MKNYKTRLLKAAIRVCTHLPARLALASILRAACAVALTTRAVITTAGRRTESAIVRLINETKKMKKKP